MKLLNNHGWGIKEMLLLTGIMLLFLLVAAYYIYVLYTGLNEKSESEYLKLELKLKEGAVAYNIHNDHKDILSVEELKDLGYINSFYDQNGKECNGYVMVKNDKYNSYINCPNYKTKKYDSQYE